MDETKLKKILENALVPLKSDIQGIKEELASVKDVQQNQILPSVVHTESVLTSYADAYKMNKKNIERLDDRVTTLEEENGIAPLPELVIHR